MRYYVNINAFRGTDLNRDRSATSMMLRKSPFLGTRFLLLPGSIGKPSIRSTPAQKGIGLFTVLQSLSEQ